MSTFREEIAVMMMKEQLCLTTTLVTFCAANGLQGPGDMIEKLKSPDLVAMTAVGLADALIRALAKEPGT